MRKIPICCFFMLFMLKVLHLSAQYDLSLEFQRPSYSGWDQLIEQPGVSSQGIFNWKAGAGFAYRIFPNEFRLGYRPGIQAFYGQNSLFHELSGVKYDHQIIQAYLNFPVQVFPFDLWGDCNCPTFGRQHDFFQKSFYLEFIPAFSLKQLRFSSEIHKSVSNDFSFHAGIGAGLNFAFNDLLTLSPMLSYHYGYPENWDGLGAQLGETDVFDRTGSSIWQLTLKASFYNQRR